MKSRRIAIACAALLAVCGLAGTAFAQSPGAPQVTVLPDNSVLISYAAPVTPPPNTVLAVTYNGALIGSFPIGTATSVYTGRPVALGSYTVQVVWGPGVASPVTAFLVPAVGGFGTPSPTTMLPPVTTGNSVVLTWTPSGNATAYEVEAFFFSTSQTLSLLVGNQTSLTVPNIPFGNYGVRVRGRNAFGVGPYSNQVLVNIAPTFRLRDLEVTLTWNTQSDIDLHVVEPNGTRVSWQMRNGVTARLDRDNTTGFGPEIVSVELGAAAPGVYQVFIVHYRGAAPTTSTIAISLNVGTPSVRTAVFTRQTTTPDATRGYNVALVDVRSGVIGENFGTRTTPAADASELVVKPQQ